MLSFLKAVREMSWVLVTQMMKCLRASYVWKNAIVLRDCVLFKEWLQKKRIIGYWSKKRDRSMRVFIEKCLLCTLCDEEFIFSFTYESCKSHIHGLNMCVKRIFGFISKFDDWTRANPSIYVRLRELSRMTVKVCDSSRMAGKDWENTHMAG